MSHSPILLFDFDGVVITQKALEYAALKLLKKRFYKFQNIENLRLIDFARLFEEADSKNRIKALIRAYKVYNKYIPSRWRRIFFFMKYRRTYPIYEKYETLKHDLKPVLVKLKANGFPLAIVSNTSEARLNFFRNKLDLDNYFSIYISRDNTPYRKPNPYPILLALKYIKMKYKIPIKKDNVYFIGDLPADIETAKNAGINSIALLSGHGLEEDLEESKPTITIQEIKTLLEIEPFKKFILD
ncbi:MAG: HAD family hydrolase [Candidatus Hermodarchaeota archaeon]